LKKNILTCILFCLTLSDILSAQEALLSVQENYYSFLSLRGLTNRPTLNFRTFSDSVWAIDESTDHPWMGQNLGTWHNLFGNFRIRIHGPELFMSVNTAAPYGQNDGVLWQGRGFNSMFRGGVRIEGHGLELTLLPHVAFSQNLAFDFIQPNYSGPNYAGRAEDFGYYGVRSIDAPQRFGDRAFFDWDFGDTEIRYTWRTLTVGFGTQAIWLGPAQLNPIIHSNNATAYPRLDIGLRRQAITLPWRNLHIGDIEFRAWWGRLSESDWFDNDDTNNHNLITGFAIAYNFPSFLTGLTIGFNRIMLSKWDTMNFSSIFTLLWPFMDDAAGIDENDQRASIVIDYLLPLVGINVYFEWGRNDFSPGLHHIIRYPFHTQAYTFGVRKAFHFTRNLKGVVLLETTYIEASKDYLTFIPWATTFYSHHIITQGHTNRGQWLGAGIGTGGNSQYLEFKLYFPRGYGRFFLQRRNPDLDFTWFMDTEVTPGIREASIRTFFDFGISALYHLTPNFVVSPSFVFRDEHNPLNRSRDYFKSDRRYNAHFSILFKYIF